MHARAIMETPSNDELSLGKKLSELMVHLDEFMRSRNQGLVVRNQVSYQCTEFARKQVHVLESARELLDEVSTTNSNLRVDHQRLYERLGSDCEALVQAETEFKSAEDRLQQIESSTSEWGSQIIAMKQVLSDLLARMNILPDTSDFPERPVRAERTDPPPPQPHPCLQDYYDKAGDVKIYRERLHDATMEYYEALGRHRHFYEQDSRPEATDADFQNQWDHYLRAMQSNLDRAKRSVNLARQACVEAGLDAQLSEEAMRSFDHDGNNIHQDRDQQDVSIENAAASTYSRSFSVTLARPEFVIGTNPFSALGSSTMPSLAYLRPFADMEPHEKVESWTFETFPRTADDFEALTTEPALRHDTRSQVSLPEYNFPSKDDLQGSSSPRSCPIVTSTSIRREEAYQHEKHQDLEKLRASSSRSGCSDASTSAV